MRRHPLCAVLVIPFWELCVAYLCVAYLWRIVMELYIRLLFCHDLRTFQLLPIHVWLLSPPLYLYVPIFKIHI